MPAPRSGTVKIPRLRTEPAFPTGPRLYRQPKKLKQAFPGTPPPGFLAGELHGSASEWPIYAGVWKALGCKPDDGYRRAPFGGDPEGKFVYQAWLMGGRSTPGGAVADFEVRAGRQGPSLLIRVQSYRFHLTFGPQVIAYDDKQKQSLEGFANVVDAYESDFLGLQGSDLVVYCKGLLGLITSVDPIRAGTVRRP